MFQITVFEMVVLIVLISTIGQLIRQRMRTQKISREQLKELEQKIRRIDELEERIRVLERIVTDPKENLRRDIGAL
ncbi:hypothetical protein [Gynuella sp.]|uniref:hypothetical protein n=1 Tax=Gynuella sp. TaxID=2969146 RepID=UPI003D0A3E64